MVSARRSPVLTRVSRRSRSLSASSLSPRRWAKSKRDPIAGYSEAKVINYDVSREYVKRRHKKDLTALDQQLEDKKITQEQYTLESRKLDKKYDYTD